jgi:hypothetical protein
MTWLSDRHSLEFADSLRQVPRPDRVSSQDWMPETRQGEHFPGRVDDSGKSKWRISSEVRHNPWKRPGGMQDEGFLQ